MTTRRSEPRFGGPRRRRHVLSSPSTPFSFILSIVIVYPARFESAHIHFKKQSKPISVGESPQRARKHTQT